MVGECVEMLVPEVPWDTWAPDDFPEDEPPPKKRRCKRLKGRNRWPSVSKLCGREGVLFVVACMVVLVWHRSSSRDFSGQCYLIHHSSSESLAFVGHTFG